MVKKHSVRFLVVVSLLSFFIGILISATTLIYFSIPDSFVIPATYAIDHTVVSGQLNVETITNQDLSIHFLELGNKYTGDCTLIKVGDTEILIDAGSRVSSVPAIKNYLDQFVSDKVIEYVIVTHAHQDHIAGFGTSANVNSIFDLYDIGTVIQFVNTQSNSQVYKNYCRELDEVQKRCGTQVFTALQCVEQTSGAKKIYNLSSEIKLEILDQKYYHSTTAKNENDNSVCCQIIQSDKNYYLFTGDLESDGELSLVELNSLHQVELFKAGHHGSKTSSSTVLLDVIRPKHVCVCCCAGSSEYTTNISNQFPTQDFIDRIAPYTDCVFVTTLCVDYKSGKYESFNGNIVVYSKNKDYVVNVMCAKSLLPLKDSSWFKENRKCPSFWL